MGTLSFVDPIGRGGLKRLFKLDPSSLINFFTLTAVLLTAIGKNELRVIQTQTNLFVKSMSERVASDI